MRERTSDALARTRDQRDLAVECEPGKDILSPQAGHHLIWCGSRIVSFGIRHSLLLCHSGLRLAGVGPANWADRSVNLLIFLTCAPTTRRCSRPACSL